MYRLGLVIVLIWLPLLNQCGFDNESLATPKGAIPTPNYGYYLDDVLWETNSLSVCWAFLGFEGEKQWVRDAIEIDGWEEWSNLNFTDWSEGYSQLGCQILGADIIIKLTDSNPEVAGGLGNSMAHMKLNFEYTSYGPDDCTNSEPERRACIQNNALHEFGHAIGIDHEANRSDSECNLTTEDLGNKKVGNYDPFSIMNYCNTDRWSDPKLSPTDIQTARHMYGPDTTFGVYAATLPDNKVISFELENYYEGESLIVREGVIFGGGPSPQSVFLSDGTKGTYPKSNYKLTITNQPINEVCRVSEGYGIAGASLANITLNIICDKTLTVIAAAF